MEKNERLNNLEQGSVTTDESLNSAVVVFCRMEINVTSHGEEHNLPWFPVGSRSEWQGKVSVLIDVGLQILFIAPPYLSSCPFSISLPSTISRYCPPLPRHSFTLLCCADCDPALQGCPPTHSGLASVCSLPDPGPSLPQPWLHRSSDKAKIGRLTRPREKVMGSGLWWTVCVASSVNRLRVYMLCLAVPFGLWWRLRMACFPAENYL